MTITIYQARKILTMNPANPEGTHIAVRDGLILGVGSLDEVAGWGDYELDDTFKDHVIVPGFVEAHAHIMAAGIMQLPYVGFFDRKLANGSTAPGIRSYDALLVKLKEEDRKLDDPNAPLVAGGFDPI
ncbi:MAG: amidohydrolase, partial [Pseudomonadales bacterium]|nr:amidohydrolase [Pseudomonadales bacterium]